MVAAYTQEREHWLRNQNAARAARVRRLLSGDRSDLRAAEATLGYRLRQYHVGMVCWIEGGDGAADELTRLERAVGEVAVQAASAGDPVFLPRDESSAWAWLPLGIRGNYKTTAERLVLHKNTVQYRIRKAEESLGRPVSENRQDVELALQVSYWLGPGVLRPATPSPARAGATRSSWLIASS